MSHRSRLASLRKEHAPAVPGFANVQRRPEPQPITPEQLIPMMLQKGVPAQWKLDVHEAPEPFLVFWAKVGPIEVPVIFREPELANLEAQLSAATARVRELAAQAAEPAEPGPAEDLLAESVLAIEAAR